ncbi:MAG: AMP-binding protein [Nocardioides sp.]|uniref:AMP-binding protein n=1 Tax=Nocardioides sp. TaxID=35761 RepID=UPI0023A16B7A|nr:AMP-binding protein [Nocardioides sp.]MDE0775415.1 AMP-binding protein [Nocardioides sp.]
MSSPAAPSRTRGSRRHDLDHFLLRGRDTDVALVEGTTSLTYGALRSAVEVRAGQLLAQPAHDEPGPLLLELAPDLPSVVTYLAALALHRPVLLVEPGESAAERRDEIVQRWAGPVHTHPDLALLLSTSGSTGSPKLVRLSRDNVLSNASAIADYLDLRPTDRGVTTLPLHYCYGLSVLHSHLAAGASVVLTDLSVADACFWDLAAGTGVTGLAGVPYTYELLEASGFADRDLPSLRYLTQAGGRMDPARVRSVAQLGQCRGFDLFVMYGQTEATARMAYLPPSLAATRPEAVGVAVPGGSLRIADPDRDGVGELVYAGPNVMMGYAVTTEDLARGAELTELRTGDRARLAPDGLVEIVGRSDRMAKVFGLRLDLDRLEQELASLDPGLRLVARGDVLHVFHTRHRVGERARRHLQRLTGLSASCVRAHRLDELPRTASGKVDDALLRRHLEESALHDLDATSPAEPPTPEGLRRLYATVLGRPDAGPDDSFVTLGGDSLCFVELSTRLGSVLGQLPREWPTMSVTELAGASRTSRWSRRWSAPLEIGVVLRALAILIVVITHVDLVLIPGGAHLLLAVAGYHLARFTLPTPGRGARTRRILTAIAAVAVPSSLWIGACALVTGDYRWTTAFYLNGARSYRAEGGLRWTLDWQFWFLEAIVWGFLAIAVLLAVPAVDRWHRARPFTVAAAVVAATTALRYASVGVQGEGVERYAVPSVLFVLALGWAAAEARTTWQRLAVLAASYAGLYGYFGDRQRELIVVGSVALLLWLRPVRLPTVLARPVQAVATASLWIYLTHWQVYPELEAAGRPLLAIGASLVVGVLAHALYQRVEPVVRARLRATGPSRGAPRRGRAEHPTAPRRPAG